MSSVRLQRPNNLALDTSKTKSVTFKEDTLTPQTVHSTPNTISPRKFRYDSDVRKRKRAHSCSFSWDNFNNKRRKPSGTIVLPSKFLLGGNITDPLNLEALDKEDPGKSCEEPFGSCRRGGGTVRVIIPPNINDPLNLDACSEDGDRELEDAISRQRRRRKTRKRKRRNSEPGGVLSESLESNRLCTSLDDTNTPRDSQPIRPMLRKNVPTTKDSTVTIETTTTTTTPTTLADTSTALTTTTALTTPVLLRGNSESRSSRQQEEASSPVTSTQRHPPVKKTRTKSENKIVSPVVPQPGSERKRHCPHQRHPSVDKHPDLSYSHLVPPKHIHPKNAYFQYGNYNQYYGYRNIGHKVDPRLKLFKKEWFAGKEVLDIGCNIGHITLSIARDFSPQRIVGIDIDRKLVNIARKNIKHYLRSSPEAEDEFPVSMRLLYGPLTPPVDEDGHRKFPYNVKFCQSNYVLENDSLLETVRAEFDAVLCLSVTKWIHLNWGDEGLKRFFRRIFRNLKPGGLLVFEPQAWPSYKKKRKITKEIFENYKKIRLFPNKFGEFLTADVGFIFVQKSSFSQHYSKGFDRPIYLYKKPPSGKSSKSPSQSVPQLVTDSSSENLPSGTPASSSQSAADDGKTATTTRLPTSLEANLLKASSSSTGDTHEAISSGSRTFLTCDDAGDASSIQIRDSSEGKSGSVGQSASVTIKATEGDDASSSQTSRTLAADTSQRVEGNGESPLKEEVTEREVASSYEVAQNLDSSADRSVVSSENASSPPLTIPNEASAPDTEKADSGCSVGAVCKRSRSSSPDASAKQVKR